MSRDFGLSFRRQNRPGGTKSSRFLKADRPAASRRATFPVINRNVVLVRDKTIKEADRSKHEHLVTFDNCRPIHVDRPQITTLTSPECCSKCTLRSLNLARPEISHNHGSAKPANSRPYVKTAGLIQCVFDHNRPSKFT